MYMNEILSYIHLVAYVIYNLWVHILLVQEVLLHGKVVCCSIMKTFSESVGCNVAMFKNI